MARLRKLRERPKTVEVKTKSAEYWAEKAGLVSYVLQERSHNLEKFTSTGATYGPAALRAQLSGMGRLIRLQNRIARKLWMLACLPNMAKFAMEEGVFTNEPSEAPGEESESDGGRA